MAIFHLENKLKEAADISGISGVYWCARDMDPSPVGNHHFITFVYESEEEAKKVTSYWRKWNLEYFCEKNDRGLTIFFTTMGVGKNSKGDIKISFNPSSDLQSIHEIAKDSNTSWDSADYDLEAHKMPLNAASLEYNTNSDLMQAVLENIYKFKKLAEKGIEIDYILWDENCACTVNTIFKQCGFPKSVREEQGEFSGTDWGEENEIPSSFFDFSYIGNLATKEIHIPQCSWADNIDRENQTEFFTVSEAISQGYNGCAHCLLEIDTDIKDNAPEKKYALHLVALTCRETEDVTGADSAYLKINGAIVWGPEQINDNEKRSLANAPVVKFADTIKVELYDQDLGLVFDKDDHLGSATISSEDSKKGIKEVKIKGDGASYIISYRVEEA
ncbi:MAG: hypothetical protein WC322_05930 [Candidatus Paceibacterota bacterium]|jgi:hypothetical protein